MEFGLTSTTIKRIKINKLDIIKEEDYRFIWEVNYTNICGKMLLIIVNSDTRYCMIYSDIKPNIWKNFESFLIDAVELALKREGFSNEEINKYFSLSSNISLTKTHGPKAMGGMKHLTVDLQYYDKILVDGMFQYLITDDANDFLCHIATHPEYEYVVPKEFFVKRMKELINNFRS